MHYSGQIYSPYVGLRIMLYFFCSKETTHQFCLNFNQVPQDAYKKALDISIFSYFHIFIS